jgi:hypothetical protein
MVRTNFFLARGGATHQVTFCGMLDLDRVEMILPQVHLRNGELSASVSNHLHLFTTQAHTILLRSREALQRGISPTPSSLPALLSQGTD